MKNLFVIPLLLFLGNGSALQQTPREWDRWPGLDWEAATPTEMGMDKSLLAQARNYALTGQGSGYIIRGGRLVMSWGDPRRLYDLKSTTKSIGVTALGLAMMDGKIRLEDKAQEHHPALGLPPEENARTGWLEEITILHLATQTAGFEKPGGYTRLLFRPGTRWDYSDSGPNWLAECTTLAYGRDLEELLFERVFTPLGIKREDLAWRQNAYRPELVEDIPRREIGSGISANVDAMARIGYLYLRNGDWNGKQILPAGFVNAVSHTVSEVRGLEVLYPERFGNASNHYGLLWWNNADGTLPGVPRDAYWSWGLYDSLIVVIPSLDIVVSRAGESWKRNGAGHYEVLQPFLGPIVKSVQTAATQATPPYPYSPVITGVAWQPKESIFRGAEGSDNWPLAWADDNDLYAAYGDGWGFSPRVPQKLSLGLARISGDPPDLVGVNVRSPSGERIGDGSAGQKASGMLMIGGRLYMWVRNSGNAQLAWSDDHGKSWSWSDWNFTTSFGHPTFLNFGRDYAEARDDFVYIYSHDQDSAYEPADRMVLARVHHSQVLEREAYEFFQSREPDGHPIWTSDITQRGAVFKHPGNCYRSSVSYNAGLDRYLWCQIIPGTDTRFEGGLAIYDAPEPWGPWTTVFFTERWDVGPGENCSFPTKWMSEDGKTLHMVFSGDDSFSVRKVVLTVAGK